MSAGTDMGQAMWDRLIDVICDTADEKRGTFIRSEQSKCAVDLYLGVRDELVRRDWSWDQAHVEALAAVAVFARGHDQRSMTAGMLLAAYAERPR